MNHIDPTAFFVLSLAILLISAKIGGEIAIRLKQPAVLGELMIGIVLGNLHFIPLFSRIKTDATINMLATLGVIILLFEVGLESTIGQMLKVGWTSLWVAVLGVITPFILGFFVSFWFFPEAGVYTHIFLGATLTATSVGITARVLKDLNRAQTAEARIILGAAVIDDVLGLLVLAVVAGMISAASLGGSLSVTAVGLIALKAIVFLFGSLFLGVKLSPIFFKWANSLQSKGILLTAALAFCFLLSWLANVLGLAPIVGAFAAGLILENVHYQDFIDKGEHQLETLIHPLATFLAPLFFVLMGMHTDLSAFTNLEVLGFALVFTLVAVLGKQICSLGVYLPNVDKLSIGIGMIPRGEVGLIFANIGLGLSLNGQPIITRATFAAIVIMVMLTTMMTPPLLKWSFQRAAK